MKAGLERIEWHNNSLETDCQPVDPEDEKLRSDHEPDTSNACKEPEAQDADFPNDDTFLDKALGDIEDEEDEEGDGAGVQQAPESKGALGM